MIGYGFEDGPNCTHNALYNFLASQNQKATIYYIGAMCLTGHWRPSVRLQMGVKSALVSAGLYVLSTSELIVACVSWQTLGHIVTVSFFGARRSVIMHDGFLLLMPVRSDGIPEPGRVRGAVVYCECLWRSTLHMLIRVLLPD